MALDHSRLSLENKSGRIFCVRQIYFTKSCQQVWGRVNQPFILFIHHIWGETVPWGAVFTKQTSDRMQYFTILKHKLHSFNQDDQALVGFYRPRVVPHFSSGIVERAKRERAWKSPHARKGDTRRGERKMRDYRQSPSFWPFTADWFWSVKFVSPSKSIKRIQWHPFPYWAVIALVIGKLRGMFIASKRKPRY